MKKILAIGAMLLSSGAILVPPAAAAPRFDSYPAYSNQSGVERARLQRLRLERRLERLRLERLRRERERERQAWLLRHRAWGR